MLCVYPDCVKNTQEVNKCIYAVLGTHWNRRYPDCVRNIRVVNGHGYTLPGTHWNALCHCFQLLPGIFTLAFILSCWVAFCQLFLYKYMMMVMMSRCPCGSADWPHCVDEVPPSNFYLVVPDIDTVVIATGSPLVIKVEDTEDSKPKDGRHWNL